MQKITLYAFIAITINLHFCQQKKIIVFEGIKTGEERKIKKLKSILCNNCHVAFV